MRTTVFSRVVLVAWWLWIGGLLPSPAQAETHGAQAGELVVVASIHPLADLARSLVGEDGEVHTLLPPGLSPHGFSPTPRAMATLSGADVVLVVGRGIDPWAIRMAERAAPRARVLDLNAIVLGEAPVEVQGDAHADDAHAGHGHHDHHHHHDHAAAHDCAAHGCLDHQGPNPHLWLDPLAVRDYLHVLHEQLRPMLPTDRHAAFDARLAAMLDEVLAVHDEYRDRLGPVAHRRLITFHNAFDPLAARYGLEVVSHLSPIDLAPGGDVTPARLDAAVRAIEAYGLPTVYVEPQFHAGAAERIAERTGVRVLTIDPLGHPGIEGRRTWPELMRYNLDRFVAGQSPPATP